MAKTFVGSRVRQLRSERGFSQAALAQMLEISPSYLNQIEHDARPLTARVGERVRIWVLAAGPNRGSDFHVVGGQFDTVWSEGGYLLRAGTDAFGSTGGGAQVRDALAGVMLDAATYSGTYTLNPRLIG